MLNLQWCAWTNKSPTDHWDPNMPPCKHLETAWKPHLPGRCRVVTFSNFTPWRLEKRGLRATLCRNMGQFSKPLALSRKKNCCGYYHSCPAFCRHPCAFKSCLAQQMRIFADKKHLGPPRAELRSRTPGSQQARWGNWHSFCWGEGKSAWGETTLPISDMKKMQQVFKMPKQEGERW